jgi:galactoside 2-L-fucosyltransferase 1/2
MNRLLYGKQLKIMGIAMFLLCAFYISHKSIIQYRFPYFAPYFGPFGSSAMKDSRQFTTTKELPLLNLTNDRMPCVVVLKEKIGRLGNRLFMFASAYGIARTHNCYLYISDTFMTEMEGIFDMHVPFWIKKSKPKLSPNQSIQYMHNDCKFHQSIMRPYAISYLELKGYWQAYGHFAQFASEIRSQLQFKNKIVVIIISFFRKILSRFMMPENNATFSDIKQYISKNMTVKFIGIHIRRGDFLKKSNQADGRTVSSTRFIFEAMEYFSKRYHNGVLFIVATDDKDYSHKIFNNDSRVFITPKSYTPAEDLAILATCEGTIVTAGSFGWWAAFLANGVVVHDKEYPRSNSRLASVCPRMSYYPPWFLFL